MAGQTGLTRSLGSAGEVVVGVDGGGTKTDVVVAALDGEVLALAHGGAANPEGIGATRMATVIAAALDEALRSAGRTKAEVVASAFGLAGVDWEGDLAAVNVALDTLGLRGPRHVVNDSLIALRAGCTGSWGIVSSVGTGTVTAGVNRAGESFRTMAVGWGEPSGSWTMVSDCLHAIAACHHHTGATTSLTGLFLEALGEPTVPALFEAITRARSSVGSHLAPLLDRAAAQGDQVALDLLDRIAGQHAAMVVGVADRLSMVSEEFELVTSGGVHAAGGLFTEHFSERVISGCPRAIVVPLIGRPVMGAVDMALSLVTATAGAQVARGTLPDASCR